MSVMVKVGTQDGWCSACLDEAAEGPAVTRLAEVEGEVERLRHERDSAQEHMAYHLRDFRPNADMAATGDLAVDMAAFAERMMAERDAARAAVERVEAYIEECEYGHIQAALRAALRGEAGEGRA
jgi:hypothetical protein